MKKLTSSQLFASRNLEEKNNVLEKITATIVQANCSTMMSTSGSRHHHLGMVSGLRAKTSMNSRRNIHISGSSGNVNAMVSPEKLIWIDAGMVNRNIHQAIFQLRPSNTAYKKAKGTTSIK